MVSREQESLSSPSYKYESKYPRSPTHGEVFSRRSSVPCADSSDEAFRPPRNEHRFFHLLKRRTNPAPVSPLVAQLARESKNISVLARASPRVRQNPVSSLYSDFAERASSVMVALGSKEPLTAREARMSRFRPVESFPSKNIQNIGRRNHARVSSLSSTGQRTVSSSVAKGDDTKSHGTRRQSVPDNSEFEYKKRFESVLRKHKVPQSGISGR